MSKDSDLYVSALARGLSVIETFGPGRSHQTLAEVAKLTGLNRATVRRLLHTLVDMRYADFDGQRFSLNSRTLRLGYAYLSSLPFWELAQKRMEKLADQYGESWALGVLEDTDVVFVARVQSASQIMAINLTIGSRMPLYASGVGRVLLAGLPDADLNRYLAQVGTLSALTSHTLTTVEALRAKIEETRQQGWTISNQEYEYGLMALAVPVRDRQGRVIAALNLGSHANRMTPEQMVADYLKPLQQAAADIGQSADALGNDHEKRGPSPIYTKPETKPGTDPHFHF